MSLTAQDKIEVRTMIREETEDMRSDIGELKSDVRYLKVGLKEFGTKLNAVVEDVRYLKVEFEDFGSKLDTVVEYISDERVRRDIDRHEQEIQALKSEMQVVKAVIKQKP